MYKSHPSIVETIAKTGIPMSLVGAGVFHTVHVEDHFAPAKKKVVRDLLKLIRKDHPKGKLFGVYYKENVGFYAIVLEEF